MESPVHIERNSVKSIGSDFLEHVCPEVGIGKSPRMKLSRQYEYTLSLDEERVRVPSDCVCQTSGVSSREICMVDLR